jgi:hypothetical protein
MIQTDGPGHRRAFTLRESRDPLKVGLLTGFSVLFGKT